MKFWGRVIGLAGFGVPATWGSGQEAQRTLMK
jgi:hypothetical protein